ncbi:hypothetical protein D3C78_1395880 [compost metagenome]
MFTKDGQEIIDKHEVRVSMPGNDQGGLHLRIFDDPKEKVHYLEIYGGRIISAITPHQTTRKRFEVPRNHPVLQTLFIDVAE